MNKLLISIFFIVFSAFPVFVFASPNAAKTMPIKKLIPVYTQDKQNILVTKNQPEFTVKLKSNPTTGYSWFLREYNANLLTPIKHTFEAPQKQLMGASGFEFWTFKLKPNAFSVPHQTTLRLVYVRPWQNDDTGTQVIFYITTQES